MKNAYKGLVGKSKVTDYLEQHCSVWKLILKEDIKKYAVRTWTGFAG